MKTPEVRGWRPGRPLTGAGAEAGPILLCPACRMARQNSQKIRTPDRGCVLCGANTIPPPEVIFFFA